MAGITGQLLQLFQNYSNGFKVANVRLIGGVPHVHKPKPIEKYYLVWGGRYKNISEIPEFVSVESLQKAKTKCRIRLCNYMIVAALIGCVINVVTGKRAVERGESITKMNLDWHAEEDAKALALQNSRK